jgi:hypothetical protein
MSNTQNIIDELALRVSDAPYDHTLSRALQRLKTLNAENVQLKARITGGIRVYVEYGDEHEMFINETAVSENLKNATLLLDEEE